MTSGVISNEGWPEEWKCDLLRALSGLEDRIWQDWRIEQRRIPVFIIDDGDFLARAVKDDRGCVIEISWDFR